MYCRRCGASLHQGVVICPECGARQRRQSAAVRCAQCGGRVTLGLSMCPHCGRNVRPAGPRWGWWAAGVAVVLLGGLWGAGKLPIERIGQELADTRARLAGLIQVFGPAVSAERTPAAPTQTPQVLAQVTIIPTPTPELRNPEATEALPTETSVPVVSVTITATLALTPTSAATGLPTETPTPLPTLAPTATSTPPPTATATQPPPTATAKPATGGQTTYRVQSGDTLSSIATRFGVSWEDLAAANGLTARSVLRIGQELVIPGAGAAVRPTATLPPRPTATPLPPTPTPAPYLEAPVLTGPGDQTPFSGGNAIIELNWQAVPGMDATAQYQIIMRWVEQGAPQEHHWVTTATSTRVPLWLWSKADQPARQYTWFVRVVTVTTDGQGGERIIPLSLPSATRVIYWG